MMVVELAGTPGSGKTTLLPAVIRACEAAGLRAFTVEQAARTFACRTMVGRLAALLPPGPRRRALWAIYYLLSALAAVRLAWSYPRLAWYVIRSQRRRPAAADVKNRRTVYWYFRIAGAYAFLRAKGRPGEALVVDEGFLHRALQLHASSVEQPEARRISAYVEMVPRCDVVVVVRAPVEACRDRVHARGVWTRLSHRNSEEIDRFLANAHQTIEFASQAARRRGWLIVDADNTGDVGSSESRVERGLEEVLGTSRSRNGHPGRRPRIVVPRASRLADGFSARLQPPTLSTEVCEAVLEMYGLVATGRPDNVPFGARNGNVVVSTSAGRKVLRRHRDITPLSTALHEHSVLRELERKGFPAVRLTRTPTGETLTQHEGHRYALFAFEDAVNLSSCYMTTPGRLQLLDIAGRTLARMHSELADFAPEVPHHLGFRGLTGERADDLRWYLVALEDLSSRPLPVAGRARGDHGMLTERRRDIESRLVRLHEVVEGASLPQVLIHGDFGLHNLLFRADGSAVVHDFELARRDWRLVDLVIVVSRMSPDWGRAFLEGYRRVADLPAAEWRYLSDVWEYYRLTGAVRSWHSHFAYGGDKRLATAVSRVKEAERVRQETLALWR